MRLLRKAYIKDMESGAFMIGLGIYKELFPAMRSNLFGLTPPQNGFPPEASGLSGLVRLFSEEPFCKE